MYIYVISYINIHTLLTTAYVLEGICTDCADYFHMNIIASGLKYRSLQELLYMKHNIPTLNTSMKKNYKH